MLLRLAVKEAFILSRSAKLYCSRAYSSGLAAQKPDTSTETEKPGDEVATQIDNSALAERFTQILEEKMASGGMDSSLVNSDPTLLRIFQNYDKGTGAPNDSDQRIKEAMSYIKSEPLLTHNKHAKDISTAVPWKGTESNEDANLRMIVDLKPKAIRVGSAHINSNKIFTPPPTLKQKVEGAKSSSLEYLLNKEKQGNEPDEEEDNFRDLYKERLLGPSMLINSASPSIDLVGSMASNRINASINQQTGLFDSPEMKHVRGKPLNSEHLKNCTDSNYFMNQVLNINDVLPPWIDSQQSINSNCIRLRAELDQIWFNWIMNDSPISATVHATTANVSSIVSAFEVRIKPHRFDTSSLRSSDMEYLEERMKLLNSTIRTYNLQCPSSNLHKFKLVPVNEIRASYDRVVDKFPTLVAAWYDQNRTKKNVQSFERNTGGFLNLFGEETSQGTGSNSGTDSTITETQDGKLHIWKAIKDVFK